MKNKQLSFALFFVSILSGATLSAAEILYIGDSHSTGCFGRTLDVSFRTFRTKERPALVVSQASCGTASSHWLKANGHVTKCGALICDQSGTCDSRNNKTDSLGGLLEKEKPKVTIVALGTNMIKGNRIQFESETRSLLLKIKQAGSQCVWIGPPQAAEFFYPLTKFNEFVEKLESIVESEGCRFVNSVDSTSRENLSDSMGIHYGCKDAEIWAKKTVPILKPLIEKALVQEASSAEVQEPIAR